MGNQQSEQQDLNDNDWAMNKNFNEWSTDDIIKWIGSLNKEFAKKYSDTFLKQKITGKNFKKTELGNPEWCKKILFATNAKIAQKFADIVCERIKNYQVYQKPAIPLPKKEKALNSESDHATESESESEEAFNFSTNLNYDHQRKASDSEEEDCIGFSVGGGAKDINNFIQNVKQNRMPLLSSITYQGTFYQYLFDTKTNKRKCIDVDDNDNNDEKKQNENDSPLFYPTYCYSKAYIPLFLKENVNKNDNDDSKEFEYYMTIGLNSTIKQSDFKRKKLNLLIILDKSGSMQSSFDGSYGSSSSKSKMNVAEKSVISLLKHLTDNDRFGLISFDNDSYIDQEIDFMKNIKINELEKRIMEIKANGGTNFEIGFKKALTLYSKLFSTTTSSLQYENRIIILTDACPNSGMTDSNNLLNMVSKCAEREDKENKIYTTFIGIGLDFNSSLIEEITNVRGSNYYAVHSNDEFEQKMDEEFEYMVTPLVFNLSLSLKSEGNSCSIDNVYGCNENELDSMITNGQIQEIKTLFPSKKNKGSGGTKGGIILIKLLLPNDGNNDAVNVEMLVQYEDREGNVFKSNQFITLDEKQKSNDIQTDEGDDNQKKDNIENNDDNNSDIFGDKLSYYDNSGIHKGIVLTRYVTLIKKWIEEDSKNNPNGSNLYVSKKYKILFKDLKKYIKYQSKILNDPTLLQECDILDILINSH